MWGTATWRCPLRTTPAALSVEPWRPAPTLPPGMARRMLPPGMARRMLRSKAGEYAAVDSARRSGPNRPLLHSSQSCCRGRLWR